MTRLDFDFIARSINKGSFVLDVGCSDGSMLKHLERSRQIRGVGVEVDSELVHNCIKNGVDVIQLDIDEGMAIFSDQQFDFVVLSQTLQAAKNPERLMREMMRIGRKAIVSVPNFGYWYMRWQLGISGVMPSSKYLPHQWHNTPNIRFCTIRDFDKLCKKANFHVIDKIMLSGHQEIEIFANLRADLAIYILSADQDIQHESSG